MQKLFKFTKEQIINRGGREKIPAHLFVDPEDPTVLYIKVNDEIEILDNSIYELVAPNITFEDGDTDTTNVSFLTKPTPLYVSVEDVLTLCSQLPINVQDIIFHIRAASKMANFHAFHNAEDLDSSSDLDKIFETKDFDKEYYPFYMFVKYKAAVESLKEFYIGAVTKPKEFLDALSDLQRKEVMDLDAIKKLLDSLENEADDWLEDVITITADPKWALRGKNSLAILNSNYRPYHPTYLDRTGWTRGY